MYPALFEIVVANTTVKEVFGESPTKVYPIEAPPGTQYPYATFRTLFGTPENNLGHVPDIDNWAVQVDVYDTSIEGLRYSAGVLRDALEQNAHITAWNGEERDFITKAFKYSFTIEFWENRDLSST